MKEAQQIKGLKTQLNKALSEFESIKIEIANRKKEKELKNSTIQSLKSRIKNLESNGKIIVTEHAIIRYFERVLGVDIAEVESQILTDEVVSFINSMGENGTYPNKEFKVIVKNNAIITVV